MAEAEPWKPRHVGQVPARSQGMGLRYANFPLVTQALRVAKWKVFRESSPAGGVGD